MPINDDYRIKKKKLFIVTCTTNPEHQFEKALEVEESVEAKPIETDVEAYCPFCSTMVSFKIKGEPANDSKYHRAFKEQDERLGK
jgi:hypothetical protein